MVRLICIVLFVLSAIFCQAQDSRLEFEKLFNGRLNLSDSSERVVHLKFKVISTYYDKLLREENSIGDLYIGNGVEYYQNDRYEIFQNRSVLVFIDKNKRLLMLSDFDERGGYLNNLKMSQRRVLVDSSNIDMVKDTIFENVRVKYFVLKPKSTLEKVSGIKKIEYSFRRNNNSIYRIDILYNKMNKNRKYSMLFEEIERFKKRDFDKICMSKYFTKRGVVRQEYKQFQVVDNRSGKK